MKIKKLIYKKKLASNLCKNIKCQNGGVCNVVLRGSVPTAECWCLKNFAGFYCEIPIIPGRAFGTKLYEKLHLLLMLKNWDSKVFYFSIKLNI